MTRLIRLFLLVSLLVSAVSAEDYSVRDFRGGLNVSDSADIAPNEALLLQNLMLNPYSAESRHGYSAWNTNPIDTFPIDNIFVYEPYPDTLRLMIVCNGFIYVLPSLDDPGWDTTGFANPDSAWKSLRMSRTDEYVMVDSSEQTVHTLKPSWWYSYISKGDYISFELLDLDATEYLIDDLDNSYDTVMSIIDYESADLPLAPYGDYTIYKRIQGEASFYQEGSLLYVSDSKGSPFIYNDTTYWFLALVDSGQVNDVVNPSGDVTVYNIGEVMLGNQGDRVKGISGAEFWDDAVSVGMTFTLFGSKGFQKRSAKIIDIDSANNILELSDVLEPLKTIGGRFPRYKYKISYTVDACNYDADTIIFDDSKNWYDNQYGEEWLTGFRAVFDEGGNTANHFIYCNNDSGFSINRTIPIADNDYYYIFSLLPGNWLDSLQFPYFEQITFQNSQLLGFGAWHPDSGWDGEVSFNNALNRIWYSETLIPNCIKTTYYFGLDPIDDITTFFNLRDVLYAATNSSIWQISGVASTDVIDGDLQYSKIVDNLGIDDIDNWCQATIEYIYFIDETGLYRFNGTRPEQISYNIDPILDQYRGVNCVLGYFDGKVWISWPDSAVTYIYDELFNAFTGPMTFGMDCMNNQSADLDTNIFFFGIADTLGFVGYWPNQYFADVMPAASSNFNCIYESGNQSYNSFSHKKKVNTITWPMQSTGAASIELYVDFDSALCDSSTTSVTGYHVQRSSFNKNCDGEYFRTKIIASAGARLILRGYDVKWENSLEGEE